VLLLNYGQLSETLAGLARNRKTPGDSKTISDGTKLPLDARDPKTTTNSMNAAALFPELVPFPASEGVSCHALDAPLWMKAEQHTWTHALQSPIPESKVARLAQLCVSHFLTECRGHPLPPAAQAITLLQRLRSLSHYLDSVRLVSYTFTTENLEERC
jgi:hypothetical protein